MNFKTYFYFFAVFYFIACNAMEEKRENSIEHIINEKNEEISQKYLDDFVWQKPEQQAPGLNLENIIQGLKEYNELRNNNKNSMPDYFEKKIFCCCHCQTTFTSASARCWHKKNCVMKYLSPNL